MLLMERCKMFEDVFTLNATGAWNAAFPYDKLAPLRLDQPAALLLNASAALLLDEQILPRLDKHAAWTRQDNITAPLRPPATHRTADRCKNTFSVNRFLLVFFLHISYLTIDLNSTRAL